MSLNIWRIWGDFVQKNRMKIKSVKSLIPFLVPWLKFKTLSRFDLRLLIFFYTHFYTRVSVFWTHKTNCVKMEQNSTRKKHSTNGEPSLFLANLQWGLSFPNTNSNMSWFDSNLLFCNICSFCFFRNSLLSVSIQFFSALVFLVKKNKNQNKKPKNISCVFLTLKEINAFFFCCFFVSFFCICHGNFQNSEVYENIFVFADIKKSPLHFAIFLTWDFRARPPNCAIMCQQRAWYQKSSFLFIYLHDFLFFFSNLIQMLFDGTTKSLSHLRLFILEEYGIFWNQRCSKFNDD